MTKTQIALAIHLASMQQFTGIRAVVAYATSIISEVMPNFSTVIPVILGFVLVVGGLGAVPLIQRLGRKQILQGGTFVMAICLLIIAIGFFLKESSGFGVTIMIVTSLLIYMLDFGISLAPVVWLYIP